MKKVFNSRKLGKSITVSRPGNSYLFVNLNGQPGFHGNQICEDGEVQSGVALAFYGDDYEEFSRYVSRWYRKFVRKYDRNNNS